MHAKQPKDLIIHLPNQHLRQRSKKVGLIDSGIEEVIQKMEAATIDWEQSRAHELGVALAAIQIDIPLRIVIIRSNFEDKKDQSFQIFINPEIVKYEGTVTEDFEGCLSIKNIYGKVARHSKVRVKALNKEGKPFRITAEGFLARVFQHEIDHTNGKVFIDHIKHKSDCFFTLDKEGALQQLNWEEDIKNNPDLWENEDS
jgi:peptide deformylase